MNRDLEDNRERIKTAFEGIEPKPWEEPGNKKLSKKLKSTQ